MKLFLNKHAADIHASYLTLENAKRGNGRTHSSGWKYLEFKVRRKWKVFWEVYEKGA